MAKLLSGKEVTASLNEEIRKKTELLTAHHITPKLGIIRIGEREDDISYERGATKRCETLGVSYEKFLLPEDASEEMVLNTIAQVNEADDIHGVLLFRPLPRHLDENKIINALAVEKDIDGITDRSMASVFLGKQTGFAPCTPSACMKILDHYGIDCSGKKAVVIGRSPVFPSNCKRQEKIEKAGRIMITFVGAGPGAEDLITVRGQRLLKEADIVIVAAGRAGVIDAKYLCAGQTVIDVGINVNEEGKLCGDVNFADAEPVVDAITPVPGGVGSVTTSVLVEHVVDAALLKAGLDIL